MRDGDGRRTSRLLSSLWSLALSLTPEALQNEALPGDPFDEEVDTDRHVVVLRKALRAPLAPRRCLPYDSKFRVVGGVPKLAESGFMLQ